MFKKIMILLALAGLSLTAQEKGRLGVMINEDGEDGTIVISHVLKDGGASKAGIEKGDVIVKINGKQIEATGDVHKVLEGTKPGDKVEIIVKRAGQESNVVVVLGEGKGKIRFSHDEDKIFYDLKDLKELKEFKVHPNKYMYVFGDRPWLGVVLHPLSEQLAKHFQVESGLLIETVHKESPAEKAGLLAGDILIDVNGKTVESARDVTKELSEFAEGEQVAISIIRQGKRETVFSTVEKRDCNKGDCFDLYGHENVFKIGDGPHYRMKWHSREGDKDLKIEVERLHKEIKELKEEIKKDQ